MGAGLCDAATKKGSSFDPLSPYPGGGPHSAPPRLPESQEWHTRTPQAAEPLGLLQLPLCSLVQPSGAPQL